MALIDIIAKRGKKVAKLRKSMYEALTSTKQNPSRVAQNLFAAEGGNSAAEYLYGTLMGLKEGQDFDDVDIETAEDFVICAHIMKLPGFTSRMDDLVKMGQTWELLGNRWHQLSALASLERIGEQDLNSLFEEAGDEEGEETDGITQTYIDALLLTLEPPVGGNTIARLIREQHPAYSTDGWMVSELSDRIFTEDQMEMADFIRPLPVRLPNNCMGVVVSKFGVHPEFLILKDTYAE